MKPITYKAILTACVALLSVLSGGRAAAQEIAIKSNALMVAGMAPNFGCEFLIGESSTIDLSAMGLVNPYGMKSTGVAVRPQYRYWFNGRPMIREFVGAAVMLASYNFTARDHVHDGDALGVGLTGGYVFALGKRFNLELSGGFGLFLFRQKQYYADDNYDDYFVNVPPKPNAKGYKLLPMDLGVTFTYIIR